MQYIEIADGLSVRVDEIEAINVAEDGLTSVVKTHHNVYMSTFPYNVLLELIESRGAVTEKKEEQTLNIMKEISTPAW